MSLQTEIFENAEHVADLNEISNSNPKETI